MKKVIAINDEEERVLTTEIVAQRKGWWVTHHLDVKILPVTDPKPTYQTEPDKGNIYESNGRYYKINSSIKRLVCSECLKPANYKIALRFYCEEHFRHLQLTRPIRRMAIKIGRNALCTCGSGLKYKSCCSLKNEHQPRHYFDSRFMENPKIVKSLKTNVK